MSDRANDDFVEKGSSSSNIKPTLYQAVAEDKSSGLTPVLPQDGGSRSL
jgi:hypothetical protein